MAGRLQQDSFMDDSDDSCPLCVEEFDLSDRSFRPCPCGYQVCQFCYNNIKNNMNGLCPACRRPYDDKNIQWKVISPEEAKADVAAQARKKAAARKQEADRRKEESQNRKHLAGLRVLQKNLVYVVGMNIPGSEDHVLETLRGPNHFGQYGPIIKIVVSKTKEGQPLGIYITFASKDDAATCISALDGVPHEGRVLRAQYGTTKYCSAFLRNETCNNRNCMFLHETGEDSDSFSRQDLSSFNALSSQRSAGHPKTDPLHPPKHHVPVQQSVQSVPAAAPAVAGSSKAEAAARSDSGDNSALPNTASWAKNPQVEQSKKPERANSRSTPSPKAAQVKAATSRPQSRATQRATGGAKEPVPIAKADDSSEKSTPSSRISKPAKPAAIQRLEDALQYVSNSSFAWSLDRDLYDAQTLAIIDNFPPLIDENGGALRYALKLQRERERAKLDEQKLQGGEEEELLGSGSLQLGGEPDAGEDGDQSANRRQLGFQLEPPQSFASQSSGEFSSGIIGRSLTPQQQHNISLLKSNNSNTEVSLEQFQRPAGTSQHQSQLSNPFQSQNQPLSNLSRHGRQSSRYTFTNDLTNSAASVKPTASTQITMQQNAGQKGFGGQGPGQSGLYNSNYSNIQGPPPGLKSSGTPPFSGGGMFGQGHGFTAGIGGNFAPKGNNDEMMRDLIRSRGAGASEAGKLDLSDPSILQARMHHAGAGQSFGLGGQDRSEILPIAQANESALINSHDLDDADQLQQIASSPGIHVETPSLSVQEDSKTLLDSDLSNTTAKAPKKILPAVPLRPEAQNIVAPNEDTIADRPLPRESLKQEPLSSIGPPTADESQARGEQKVTGRGTKQETQPSKQIGKKKTAQTADARPTTLKLDAAAATESAARPSSKKAGASEKPAQPKKEPQAAPTSPARPTTPTTTSSTSARQPRTLRVVQSIEVDVANTAVASVDASRRASGDRDFALPNTPARGSEAPSAGSNPTSRGESPPPPAKSKAKTQAKKEAESKLKASSDIATSQPKPKQVVAEVIHGPIIGRKKKTKKAKASTAARPPVESNPPSPRAVEDEATSAIDERPATPLAPESDDSDHMPPIERLPSALSVISYLQKAGKLDKNLTDLFLDPPKFYRHLDIANQPRKGTHVRLDLNLQPEQIATLEQNKPVSVRISAEETIVVLPNHAVLRHLTSEEAKAYETSWQSILKGDEAFLSSTLLPAVYTMDAAWKECMSTPMAPSGYIMTEQLGHRHIAEQLSMSALGGGYETGFYRSSTDIYPGPGFDPTALATQMEDMTLEDAEQALKTSEEMVNRARKSMESEEKKLLALLRKNKKAFKD